MKPIFNPFHNDEMQYIPEGKDITASVVAIYPQWPSYASDINWSSVDIADVSDDDGAVTLNFTNVINGKTLIVKTQRCSSVTFVCSTHTIKWVGGTQPASSGGSVIDIWTFVCIAGVDTHIYGSVIKGF